MALVKPSGTISDIRGKIGGTVFANSGAGLTVRSFTSPVNPNTSRQNNQRIILNIIQQEWRLLTTTQRQCWENWIKLFPFKQNNFTGLFINAQQAFIKINAIRQLYGHPVIKNPVFVANFSLPITYLFILFGGGIALASTRVLIPANEFIYLSATYPLPATINNPGTKLKALIFPTIATNLHNITQPYVDIFGRMPVIGEKVFIKISTIDLQTGLRTGSQEEGVIIV